MNEVRKLRSTLIAPGDQAEILTTLAAGKPDAVVIDLEDSVAMSAKEEARNVAKSAATLLITENPALTVFTRVNSLGSPWFEDDIADLHPHLTGVAVPKVRSASEITRVREALADADLNRLGIMVGLDTAQGVADSREILSNPGVVACYFGASDYVADMGGMRTKGNTEVLYARSEVALSARLAGVFAIDQVVANFSDSEAFRVDVMQGKALGYKGKLCIHADQVPLANQAYTPTDLEVGRAQRLLVAYESAAQQGNNIVEFEGQFVDEPVARQARQLLDAMDG